MITAKHYYSTKSNKNLIFPFFILVTGLLDIVRNNYRSLQTGETLIYVWIKA